MIKLLTGWSGHPFPVPSPTQCSHTQQLPCKFSCNATSPINTHGTIPSNWMAIKLPPTHSCWHRKEHFPCIFSKIKEENCLQTHLPLAPWPLAPHPPVLHHWLPPLSPQHSCRIYIHTRTTSSRVSGTSFPLCNSNPSSPNHKKQNKNIMSFNEPSSFCNIHTFSFLLIAHRTDYSRVCITLMDPSSQKRWCP